MDRTTARNVIQNELNLERPVASWIAGLLNDQQVQDLSVPSPAPAKVVVHTAVADVLTTFAGTLNT